MRSRICNLERLAIAIAIVGMIDSLLPSPATAAPPQAAVGGGLQNVGGSFVSQTGLSFGFSIPTSMPTTGSGIVGLAPQGSLSPNISFQSGGQPSIPFGLGPTTPDASFGYAVRTPLGTMFFGLTASEGSTSSNMAQSGSVTTLNGGTGSVSASSLTPFVTGLTPVVGNGGASVLGERLQRLNSGERPTGSTNTVTNSVSQASANGRSAGEAVASLAEIRAEQAAEDQTDLAEERQKISLAEAALAGGKPGVARIYYQQVARHARGKIKQQALDALRSLAAKANDTAQIPGAAQ